MREKDSAKRVKVLESEQCGGRRRESEREREGLRRYWARVRERGVYWGWKTSSWVVVVGVAMATLPPRLVRSVATAARDVAKLPPLWSAQWTACCAFSAANQVKRERERCCLPSQSLTLFRSVGSRSSRPFPLSPFAPPGQENAGSLRIQTTEHEVSTRQIWHSANREKRARFRSLALSRKKTMLEDQLDVERFSGIAETTTPRHNEPRHSTVVALSKLTWHCVRKNLVDEFLDWDCESAGAFSSTLSRLHSPDQRRTTLLFR